MGCRECSPPSGRWDEEGLARALRDGEDFDWLLRGAPPYHRLTFLSTLHWRDEASVTLPPRTLCLSGRGCPRQQIRQVFGLGACAGPSPGLEAFSSESKGRLASSPLMCPPTLETGTLSSHSSPDDCFSIIRSHGMPQVPGKSPSLDRGSFLYAPQPQVYLHYDA